MKKIVYGICCLALVLGTAMQTSEARPKYLAEFKEKYPGVEGLDEVKCNVCHEGKDKKNKNGYGIAFGTTLNAKNCKDSEVIQKALVGTEAKPSAVSGKTFGDLLKENKLPGSK